MTDVFEALLNWWRADRRAGLATVTATWSSAPRQPGAMMAVGSDGVVVGSVSGGCVEAAVYDLCREAMADGTARTARFGVSDDDAMGVGLTCGGTVEVLIECVDRARFPELPALMSAIAEGRPVALLTRLDDARHLLITSDNRQGTLGSERIDDAADHDGRGLLAAGRTGLLHYGTNGERRGEGLTVLVNSWAPRARMIVFGTTDHAAATARIGAFLGYHVTVCDARPVFATRRRFPGADEVVNDWPHRYLRAQADAGRVDSRTVVCVLNRPGFRGDFRS